MPLVIAFKEQKNIKQKLLTSVASPYSNKLKYRQF